MLKLLLQTLVSALRSRDALIAENLALRHQIEVLQRNSIRPDLRWRDRASWDLLGCIWTDWRRALFIVQPETVIHWHGKGFRLYWKWLSRPRRPGRPHVSRDIRELIRQMSSANPLWGAPRVHGELLKLGIDVSQATVSKYMFRQPKPPSKSWRTFLSNHAPDIASIDFFAVQTATFQVIYVFLVLDNARRKILHFNVTKSPTSAWAGQQIVEAFPWDTAPRFILRDNDGTYGDLFSNRMDCMGIEEVTISPYSPEYYGTTAK